MSTTFNPYAPPLRAGQPREPSPLGETVIPRIFGILSITFSSITLLVLVFGMLFGFFLQHHRQKASAQAKKKVAAVAEAPSASQVSDQAADPRPLQMAAGICMATAWLLGPLLLLAIGIGQVRYKRWARLATLVWSGLILLAMVAFVVLAALAETEVAELVPMAIFSIISGIYPMLLLIFFSRPHVVAAMVR